MIDIDEETGILHLHESFVKKIGPNTELEELERRLARWEESKRQDGRTSFKIEMRNPKDYQVLHLTMIYVESKLRFIELSFTDGSLADSPSQPSKARELKRKKYHEFFFSAVLGRHRWGSIQSVFDKGMCRSYVRLEYADPST